MQKTLRPLVVVAAVSPLFALACVDGGATGLDPAGDDVEAVTSNLCTPTQLAPTAVFASAAPKQAPINAIDGKTTTRWESAYSDPQFIYVDLGSVKTVTEVKIDWQHAAAKDYRIDVSNDAVNWSAPVASKTGLLPVDHRIDDLTGFSVSARYVRMYGTARATAYGYSIWEMYIYNGSTCGGTDGGTGATDGGGSTGGAGGGGSTGTGVCASNLLTNAVTTATTASSANGTNTSQKAFDNNTGTRWESAYSDPQWIRVDLGSVKTINRVRIDWQHAAAKDYRIDVSNDGTSWSAPVISKTGLAPVDHRIDDLQGFTVVGRYVRMYGTARATAYGYSIWEMDVYGDDSSSCSNGATNLLTQGWQTTTVATNFTPTNVYTFSSNKNAIALDYTGKTFTATAQPPAIQFTQTVTVPVSGSTWRLILTISGMNNQASFPPRFFGSFDGNPGGNFLPSTTTAPSSGGHVAQLATLNTGNTLSMEFSDTLTAGSTVDLLLFDVPGFDSSTGAGQQKFQITDASLIKVN
ncbi:MAG TPA: discoidin domain-containing protein [Polyangia bacterium]|nr:discoidin domain-containing protein [Polyangia bacterium]